MKRLVLALLLMCSGVSAHAATWYIRADGGTRYTTNVTTGQCNGLYDVSYASTGGTGVNQNCAFDDIRYLWADGTYNAVPTFPAWGWVATGGDEIIVRSCIQYSAPGVSIPGSSGGCRIGPSGPNSGDWFLGRAGDPGASGMPSIPSGTSGAHTVIVAGAFAGCMFSCPAGTAKIETNGGYGTGNVFTIANSQYVDIIGFDIDDHAACGLTGTQNGCNRSYPYDDYASSGITSNTSTANVTVTDTNIHGLGSDGWHGPIGGDVTFNRVYVGYNTNGGLNLDDTSGVGSTGGMFTLNQTTIEWSGCIQEYPIVDTISALNCFDQSSGGYGDAIGTPNNDGASFTVSQSIVRYNTQDGVDLLHSFGGTILVDRSQIYGNEGQSIKLGATSSSIVHNNLIVNNCYRLTAGSNFPGAPVGFNANLGNTCRANGDVFAISWGGASNVEEFDHNTVIAGGASLLDITCSISDCSSGTKTLRDNIFIGYAVTGYNTQQLPGGFCYNTCNNTTNPTNDSMWTARSNNVYYNFRACPTLFSNESCTNPVLTAQLSIAAPLANENFNFSDFDPNLPLGSPSIGAGIAIAGLTTDFNGNLYGSPPSIGAYEFGGSPPIVSPRLLNGNGKLSGNVRF